MRTGTANSDEFLSTVFAFDEWSRKKKNGKRFKLIIPLKICNLNVSKQLSQALSHRSLLLSLCHPNSIIIFFQYIFLNVIEKMRKTSCILLHTLHGTFQLLEIRSSIKNFSCALVYSCFYRVVSK